MLGTTWGDEKRPPRIREQGGWMFTLWQQLRSFIFSHAHRDGMKWAAPCVFSVAIRQLLRVGNNRDIRLYILLPSGRKYLKRAGYKNSLKERLWGSYCHILCTFFSLERFTDTGYGTGVLLLLSLPVWIFIGSYTLLHHSFLEPFCDYVRWAQDPS